MFIKNLEIDVSVMLYRMTYGGSIGTLNFIWKVPEEESSYCETRNVKIVNKINATLPKFSTRSMRRDFLNRYCKLVKSPRSVLRNIFFELTGCEAASETKEQAEVDEHDKAIVPVGELGVPISTGVRGHNKVLAPADGPKLVATDHDFHLGGLVPSVTFVSDIPKNSNDSFFNGHIYVTTKDKVFQASIPNRHATELTRILRENYSDDDVNLETPILCLMTDGGPDHRLFIALDLDMLIAVRTAPNHSWMNPGELCMSILNLSLQHCALSRKEMPENYEKAVKHKSTLTAVRNLAFIKTGFREAYDESIKNLVKVGMSSGELRKDFIARHGRSSHYAFQLKRCNDCHYCEINPPRIPEDKFQDLHFLSNPVPGEHNQYKSFSELTLWTKYWGGTTQTRNGTYKWMRMKMIDNAGIYLKIPNSKNEKKLSREQDELILRLKEDSFYTCGGALVQDNSKTSDIVVREGLACNSPIETTCHSASLKHYLPPECVHCGTAEDLLDDTNPYISALYEQYSVVRPVYEICRSSGMDTKKLLGKRQNINFVS
ncbi:unnamed protein product [Mytilus coruscus]|uniref:Uncharacterized protein n=1 Tax=Mytilus coruscus TaxID=42192 RepID=A0A6J7ZTG2_MYTCO|nr:unnamed protein product [Mytilus coruscus]